MFKALFTLIPTSVWGLLGKILMVLLMAYLIYARGVAQGKLEYKEQYTKLYDIHVNQQILELESRVASYLELLESRQSQKSLLENSLNTLKEDKLKLLRKLENAKNTTSLECSILSDSRYELYQQLYNSKPAD